MKSVYLVLSDIRSAHNVGSIFRTADAAGVKEIFLCGTSPTPVDRFGRKRSDITKVALGAEDAVSWSYFLEVKDCIAILRDKGASIVAVEQDSRSISYSNYSSEKDTAFILGEETSGIPKKTLDLCDEVIEIPMRGKKESLNVSVAAGVVLFSFIEESV